ncbi:MAG: DEAD/DEAH box helicase [Schleiferiaceae bacterium]|nr:DEAD/DEAH box helicase [Schleiferiaceae bacterium]
MTFKDLAIVAPILSALEKKGYTSPTPIQQQAIPILLAGKDLMGCAQTGTGKTAAFAIPIIQHLYNDPQRSKQKRTIKALVVTPTRELAIQIDENFVEYGAFANIRTAVVFGGVKQNAQVDTLRKGVDVLIATPGRLLDLMNQGHISLRDVAYFVLDEADQMLDMGFVHDIKKLLTKLPKKRQSLFFSATMPAAIVELSNKILGNYERVTIQPQQTTAERVEQGLFFVSKSDKPELLSHIIKSRKPASVLVFTRTKHGADKVVKYLSRVKITSAAIHGNKSQNNRQAALNAFKEGKIKVLIATDIAARGIDVSELELVINYDLPNIPETYVHRIGRTGRANASGASLSFCDVEERPYLKDIEKLIKQKIPVLDHPFVQAYEEKRAAPPPAAFKTPRKVEKPKKPKWRGARKEVKR